MDSSHWGPLLASLAHQNSELCLGLLTKYSWNLSKELFLDPDEDSGEDTAG